MNAQQIKDKARMLTEQIGKYQVPLDYRPLVERLLVEALTEAAKPLDVTFPVEYGRCKQCDSALLFSASRHGTGLCHPCAHQALVDIIRRLMDIFPPAETTDNTDAIEEPVCHCGLAMKDHTAYGSCTTPRVMDPPAEPPVKFVIKDAALVIKRHHDEINKYRQAIRDLLEAKSYVEQRAARGRAQGLLEDFCDKPRITEADLEVQRQFYNKQLGEAFRDTGGTNYQI